MLFISAKTAYNKRVASKVNCSCKLAAVDYDPWHEARVDCFRQEGVTLRRYSEDINSLGLIYILYAILH